MTGDLADLAEATAGQAAAVLRNGRHAIRRALSGRLRRTLGDLAVTIERTATSVAQARSRLAGQIPDGATRLVSPHDPDARPIRKGRIDKPVEFGYKAQVIDNHDASSWITASRPAIPRTLPSSRQRSPGSRGSPAARPVRAPPTADTASPRPNGTAGPRDTHSRHPAQSQALHRTPRRRVCPRLRTLVKWRTGCEGRISYLKRRYGWDRTRLDGRDGVSIWCGHGVFTHNLVKISALAS